MIDSQRNILGLPELNNWSAHQIKRLNTIYHVIKTLPVNCLSQNSDEINKSYDAISNKFEGKVTRQYAYQVKVAYDWSQSRRHTSSDLNIHEALVHGQKIYVNSYKRVD